MVIFPPTAAALHGLLLPSLPAQHMPDERRCVVSEAFSEVAGVPRKGSADSLSKASQFFEAEIHGTKRLSIAEDLYLQPSSAGPGRPCRVGSLLHLPAHHAGGCTQTTTSN